MSVDFPKKPTQATIDAERKQSMTAFYLKLKMSCLTPEQLINEFQRRRLTNNK